VVVARKILKQKLIQWRLQFSEARLKRGQQ